MCVTSNNSENRGLLASCALLPALLVWPTLNDLLWGEKLIPQSLYSAQHRENEFEINVVILKAFAR